MSQLITMLAAWRSTLASRQASERGAVAVEYGVLVAGIAVLLVVTIGIFFGSLATWFGDLADLLPELPGDFGA